MPKSWHLLADIGGTNARFAVGSVFTGEMHEHHTVHVADHETFASALDDYLAKVALTGDWESLPIDACLAVACPADRPVVSFTNSSWVIDRRDLLKKMKIPSLHVINDFEAIGYATANFAEGDWEQLGGGFADPERMVCVLGPGTGLGVCGALSTSDGYKVLPGEGGHVDFAPVGDEEIEILRLLLTRHSRVSAERLLSGAGIQNIYWALAKMRNAQSQQTTPADISTAAIEGADPVAVETLAVFFRILGSVAGNLALTFGARGGIYIAGGIVPRVLAIARKSDFRERFVAKGRFRDYLNDIPTRIIRREDPGLFGALQFLKDRQ